MALETIPRVGYRLKQLDPTAPETASRPRRIFRWPRSQLALAAAALLLLFATAIGYRLLTHADGGPAPLPTVTVLPFTALNSEPEARQQAQSVAASIANALSSVGIPVLAAPLSGDGGATAPANSARQDGADYVIHGTLRREGDIIRAWARMDQAETGLTVLSRTYEARTSEASALPDRIAGGIAGAITWPLSLAALEPDRNVQAGVLRAILSEDWARGRQVATTVVAQAPQSGAAQFVFAFISGRLLVDFDTSEADRRSLIGPARAAAARVRALLPRLADNAVLECMLSPQLHEWECEQKLRHGLEGPGSPWLSIFLSYGLAEAGRIGEADAVTASAQETDPFNSFEAAQRILLLELLGRTDRPETEPVLAAAERYWPSSGAFIEARFEGLIASGEVAEAERMLADPTTGAILEPPGREQPIHRIFQALRTRDRGDLDAARAACGPVWLPRDVAVAACLNGLALLGDIDGAFALAARIYPERRFATPTEAEQQFLRTGGAHYSLRYLFGSAAAPLRADPRFIGIAERTGTLDYWRAARPPDFCAGERAPVCALLAQRGGR